MEFFPILVLIFLIESIDCHTHEYKNILFIVVDDIGWSDYGFANEEVITPNIDRLANSGVILNQSYAYSLCTPSRNSFMSGVYAEHTGLQHSVILPEQPIGLPISFTLMPEIFKSFGYKTHMIGKWHLGFCNEMYTPVRRGFDTFYGYFNAMEDYYTHRVPAYLLFGTIGLDFWNQTADYLEPVLDKNYTHSMYAFTERAYQILEEHDQSSPLFMYFAPQNSHTPYGVPKQYENYYNSIKDEKRRKYLGLVTMLDEAIGNITKKLHDLGMLDNTLIFFTSDNGGAVYASGRNYPLRGGKMTAFEGGQRVRAFVNGPGLKPYVNEGMFHAVDWFPTILNAALDKPVEISGIDGINQWPAISQNLPSNRTSFIYNIDPYGQVGCFPFITEAIRSGNWKLIKGCPGLFNDWYPITDTTHSSVNVTVDILELLKGTQIKDSKRSLSKIQNDILLFNLKDDPYERINLANQFPDVVSQLEHQLFQYNEFLRVPLSPPVAIPDLRAEPTLWGDKWSPGWC